MSKMFQKQVNLFGRSISLLVLIIVVLFCGLVTCCGITVAVPTSEESPISVTDAETPSTEPSKTLELIFDVNVRTENGEVYFDVVTNLPEGMQLMFTVYSGNDVLGQSKTQVASGVTTAGPFSRKGEPYLPGEYILNITSPLLSLQPIEIQEILGENGENFYGDHISEGKIDYETTFVVAGDQEESQRLKEQELASLQEHLTYLNSKFDLLEQASKKNKSDWATWSQEWNTDLQQHKESFEKEFGVNINEYEGWCHNS